MSADLFSLMGCSVLLLKPKGGRLHAEPFTGEVSLNAAHGTDSDVAKAVNSVLGPGPDFLPGDDIELTIGLDVFNGLISGLLAQIADHR